MAGNFMAADRMPGMSGNVQQDVKALRNYVLDLQEQLRYILQNLSMEANFNGAELQKWVDGLDIKANTIVSNTVITNELYAEYGNVADLTVDKLRTDWKRAQRYLQGDQSPLDYICIHDEQIEFRTGTTDGSAVQLEVDGRLFWWKDAEYTQMTSLEQTAWPVMVYQYTDLVKGSIRFQEMLDAHGNVVKIPVMTLGAGSGTGNNGMATLVKTTEEMKVEYKTTQGIKTGVYLRDDGFTDVAQRRASLKIDETNQTILVQPEGSMAENYVIEYQEDASGNLTLTWPDGASFRVEVVENGS